MRIAAQRIEDAAKELYLRALKDLPPDIKRGMAELDARESDATAKRVLGAMLANVRVAESTDNLLCQDTGIPIYNVTIGRGVNVDGYALKQAIRTGCERATRECNTSPTIATRRPRARRYSATAAKCPQLRTPNPNPTKSHRPYSLGAAEVMRSLTERLRTIVHHGARAASGCWWRQCRLRNPDA